MFSGSGGIVAIALPHDVLFLNKGSSYKKFCRSLSAGNQDLVLMPGTEEVAVKFVWQY